MRRILACDYDGTLAINGIAEPVGLAAIGRWRAAGGKFLIVTGRTLDDLFGHFDRKDLLDGVVAEDGALLWNAASGKERALAPSPPVDFVADLQRRGVPVIAGKVTLYTVKPHEEAVLAAIRDRGLEHHIVFNWESVMILPSEINKGSGIRAAAEELGVPMNHVAAIGDGENDHSFLQACGQSAAVSNAVESLKRVAAMVTSSPSGRGVSEFVDVLLDGTL